jgi:hypothetical protein
MLVIKKILVEESFTCCCAAETGDTIRAADFTLEFVVVREFLVCYILVLKKLKRHPKTYFERYHAVHK